jgi:hypothetical protein
MASEKEEEDHPMSHEEIIAMLQSLRETIYELEWIIKIHASKEYLVKGEGGGEGGGPSKPPSPSSKKINHNMPLLKLDVKFEFPTYDG